MPLAELTPEKAAEIQRLLRRQRVWLVVTAAGLALTLGGYLPGLFRRGTAISARTEPAPADFQRVHPTYIRNFYVEPDGMGFRVAFTLADEKGNYSIRGGKAYVSVVDDRYGYRGQELVTVKRDTFVFTSGEFLVFNDPATSPSSAVMPVSPPRRVALEEASVSAATLGCYLQLRYVTTDGDTLKARMKSAWPWN
jgi:hypothetical protein